MKQEGHFIPFKASTLPVDSGPWLVLAPHPDDETFGMGGTLLKAAEAGIGVSLVVMTDGGLGGEGDSLVDVRRREAAMAAEFLGIKQVIFLDQPDRGLVMSAKLVARLVAILREEMPKAVFFPGPCEYHPDHRTTAGLVWAALRESGDVHIHPVSYEISVQSPANCLVDITQYADRKWRALGLYTSQMGENNYAEVVKSLNKLRTLTLPADVVFAEAFFRFPPDAVNNALEKETVAYFRSLF